MTRIAIAAGIAVALVASPALAGKVSGVADKIVTVDGKNYEISNSRTNITIKGAKGTRDGIKVGMDCTVTGAPGTEAKAIACK